jgi:hypothetical protein
MSSKRSLRALGLAFIIMLAFGAFGAIGARAEAPRWTVGGKTIVAAESKTFSATSTGSVAFTAANLKLKSTMAKDCSISGSIVGSAAGSPGKDKEVIIHCINVEVLGHEKECTVNSPGAAVGTIKTEKLESTLVWLNAAGDAEVGDTLANEANTAKPLVTVEVEGVECPLNGDYDLTGNVIAKVEPVTKDVGTGALVFPEAPIKPYWTNQTPTRTKDEDPGLKAGGVEAVFHGKFNYVLTSGELFGVEPG